MNRGETDLIAIFMTSAAVFLLLSVIIILFVFFYQRRVMRQKMQLLDVERAHQSELMRAVLETQEQERRRVAKDLHDEIGAVLSAVKLNIDLLARRAGKAELAPADFGGLGEAVGEAIADVRRISRDLMPPAVEREQLPGALELFAEKVRTAAGKRFELAVEGEVREMTPDRRLQAYRIVQELTNNSLKHAECDVLRLELRYEGEALEIKYKDDGRGFDYDVEKENLKSLGLKNLESRTGALGGELWLQSAAGQGMQATIRIPIA